MGRLIFFADSNCIAEFATADMSFHPHMTAPGSGFGHMKFMKDMKGMMNMMEQLKKHNKDGEVSVRRTNLPARHR